MVCSHSPTRRMWAKSSRASFAGGGSFNCSVPLSGSSVLLRLVFLRGLRLRSRLPVTEAVSFDLLRDDAGLAPSLAVGGDIRGTFASHAPAPGRTATVLGDRFPTMHLGTSNLLPPCVPLPSNTYVTLARRSCNFRRSKRSSRRCKVAASIFLKRSISFSKKVGDLLRNARAVLAGKSTPCSPRTWFLYQLVPSDWGVHGV